MKIHSYYKISSQWRLVRQHCTDIITLSFHGMNLVTDIPIQRWKNKHSKQKTRDHLTEFMVANVVAWTTLSSRTLMSTIFAIHFQELSEAVLGKRLPGRLRLLSLWRIESATLLINREFTLGPFLVNRQPLFSSDSKPVEKNKPSGIPVATSSAALETADVRTQLWIWLQSYWRYWRI